MQEQESNRRSRVTLVLFYSTWIETLWYLLKSANLNLTVTVSISDLELNTD